MALSRGSSTFKHMLESVWLRFRDGWRRPARGPLGHQGFPFISVNSEAPPPIQRDLAPVSLLLG